MRFLSEEASEQISTQIDNFEDFCETFDLDPESDEAVDQYEWNLPDDEIESEMELEAADPDAELFEPLSPLEEMDECAREHMFLVNFDRKTFRRVHQEANDQRILDGKRPRR